MGDVPLDGAKGELEYFRLAIKNLHCMKQGGLENVPQNFDAHISHPRGFRHTPSPYTSVAAFKSAFNLKTESASA
jgi:hypothetical protein